ncbi:hypothetical protein J2Z23_001015 [Lederbergia galactosidilyticus]|uniref:transposase n=1 Tax=Lederbergia galactosidilytica TaxID=217031 RepID=UPI001AE1E8B1|nr:transposase [Lederbergia galactosidilytica]MBP1914078.1 hypothetical protein [Lederbergia galactosidilytica]
MTAKEQRRQEKRINRRSQTKPGKIKQKSRDLSDVSIHVTNLPIKVPASEIFELYRYRWQIELLFKSWKSDMKVAQYREMKLERMAMSPVCRVDHFTNKCAYDIPATHLFLGGKTDDS